MVVGPTVPALIDVDGESLPHVLASHRGHPVLVNVWSTWCIPCVEELPMLVRLGQRLHARGLRVVFISADPPQMRDAALAMLRREGAPMPSYFRTGSDETFIESFPADWSGALPATLLLDATGRPHRFWEGAVTADALAEAITPLLNLSKTP